MPSNLKVVTRSTVPAGVEISSKLSWLMRPRMISFVFDMFICMSLFTVLVRMDSKKTGMLLTEAEGGRSSKRVVSSTNLSRPQWVARSSSLCTLCCFTATGASYQIIPWILRRATVKKIISKETNSISGYENLSSCSRDYSRQLMAEKNYLYFLNFQDTVATHVYKIKVTKSHFLGILCTKIYSNRSCLAELFKK